MSYDDHQASMQTISFQVTTLISQNYPLQGKVGGDSMLQHLVKLCKKPPKKASRKLT
jgi:hypothetical protein